MVVSSAETSSQPVTVMVEFKNACLAYRTVVASGWLENLTCFAKGKLEKVRCIPLIYRPKLGVEVKTFTRLIIFLCHVVRPAARRDDSRVYQ